MNNSKRWGFLLRLFIYITSLMVLLLLPWHYIAAGPVFCPFRRILGVPCLGCGMTRAFWQIVHLHFKSAFAYNALSFLFFPGITYLIIWDILREIKSKS